MAKLKKCKLEGCNVEKPVDDGCFFGPKNWFCSGKCAQKFIAALEAKDKRKRCEQI